MQTIICNNYFSFIIILYIRFKDICFVTVINIIFAKLKRKIRALILLCYRKNESNMKKAYIVIAAVVLFVSVVSSCKSHERCPAYGKATEKSTSQKPA
jgi:hypothetical protein